MDLQTRDQCENMQNMLEALIQYDIIQEDEITSSADSIVTVESLWNLFKKSKTKFEEETEHQNKELLEVQKYVESVRALSEERDRLNDEFELENEKLKLELKEVKLQSENELKEVETMCRQESLDELIGSSFSEQMAYLLVVRATLLDKIEVMQEERNEMLQEKAHHQELVKKLTSEDGEMRGRMEVAMGEMGGMASKLNDALAERDGLKKKVTELTQALDGIKELPALKDAKAELVTQQLESGRQHSFYSDETKKLRAELEEVKHCRESEVADLTIQIEELQEMNLKLKEVNRTLNERLGDNLPDCDRTKVYSESQKIIEEMQSALEEDETRSREQRYGYEGTIKALNQRIKELEMQNHEEMSVGDDICQASAELEEMRSQLEKSRGRITKLESELHNAHREMDTHDAMCRSKVEQLETQIRIANELQDRNSSLELQLTKVLGDLRDASDRSNNVEQERRRLEEQIAQLNAAKGDGTDVSQLQSKTTPQLKDEELEKEEKIELKKEGKDETKISRLESLLLRDTGGTADNARNSDVSSMQSRIYAMTATEAALKETLKKSQQQTSEAETKLLMAAEEKDFHETQKLMSELDRRQLEDAVALMGRRVDFYVTQLQSYADRYKNLKQKHKTKIRRIRELFFLERKSTSEESERLESRVASAELALERELAWKEEASREVCAAERERRNAINRADNAIQKLEEKAERIKELNSAKDDLLSENGLLQKQLSSLERQKIELERLIELNQRKQQKEELNTLLSSLSMHENLPDLNNNSPPPVSEAPSPTKDGSSHLDLSRSGGHPVAARRTAK